MIQKAIQTNQLYNDHNHQLQRRIIQSGRQYRNKQRRRVEKEDKEDGQDSTTNIQAT